MRYAIALVVIVFLVVMACCTITLVGKTLERAHAHTAEEQM